MECKANKKQLIKTYSVLPVFPDVIEALENLNAADYGLYAFSNGTADAVKSLLEHAGILRYFIDVISVDEIKTFKPGPAVYHHLLKRCNSTAESSWLISGNAFDVMGAKSAGLRGIWLQRSSSTVFDSWEGLSADATISKLSGLDGAIRTL